MLGTEAEASHHLGSTEEAGLGLCGGLSLGGTKVHTGGLLGGVTRVGSNAPATGNEGLWQRTRRCKWQKDEREERWISFPEENSDIYSLCFLTRCNVTRRLTYSLLYTLS